MIEFQNVCKIYADKTVLNNVCLRIETGHLVAVIGASGCGKTTLLKMVNKLILPSSGSVRIDGKDVREMDDIKLRRNMGYVIQQTGLFPHMTIRENIELIPRLEKKDPRALAEKTAALMEMVGLRAEEYLDRYPSELSGGQQQRIGVARAFASDPDVILMDEPFSALDPLTRSGLQDEVLNLQAQFAKTIVFVTHDMDEAIKLADKVCIMRGGRVLQYDTPENILKNPCDSFVAEFIGKNRIWASPEYIKAKDIMIEQPITCRSNVSLFRCMEKMRMFKIDSLMVVESKSRKLLGVLKAEQIQWEKNHARLSGEVMKTQFPAVSPEDSIVDVLKIVEENRVSNVPVLDEEGHLAGLITKSSLFTTLSQQYLEEKEGA